MEDRSHRHDQRTQLVTFKDSSHHGIADKFEGADDHRNPADCSTPIFWVGHAQQKDDAKDVDLKVQIHGK